MNSSSSEHSLLNRLAEEFAERYRQGERPALSEYTDRHPELAEEIRELFPAVVAMEQLGTVAEQATGPALSPVLGATGQVQLVFGALLAAGLWISA